MLHAFAAGLPDACHDGTALRDQCVGLGDVLAGEQVEIADPVSAAAMGHAIGIARRRAAAMPHRLRARKSGVQIARIFAKRLTERGNHAGQGFAGGRLEATPGGEIEIDGRDAGLGGLSGVRKARFRIGNRGKSSGGRVLYYIVMKDDSVLMLMA
jgi:hypothetical protein